MKKQHFECQQKKHCSILGWNFHHWNYYTFEVKKKIPLFRSEISWLIGFPNQELQSLQSSLIPFPKNRTNSCKYLSCFAPTAQVLRASTYGPEQQHPPVPRLPILVDSHRHLFDFPICSHLRVPRRSCVLKIWPLTGATNLVAIGWLSWKTVTTTPPMKKKRGCHLFLKKKRLKLETTKKHLYRWRILFQEQCWTSNTIYTHKSNSQIYYVSPSSIARILSYLISSHLIPSYLFLRNLWKPETSGETNLIHILQKGNVSSVRVQKFWYFFLALEMCRTEKRNYGEKWSIELVVAGASFQEKNKKCFPTTKRDPAMFCIRPFFCCHVSSPSW